MDYIDNKYQLTPGDYRVTNVTPFTYRDGYTYLQLMEEMRSWVSEGLVNQFSAKMQGLASDYNAAVSRLLVDVRKEMEGYHALPSQVREMLSAAIAKYDDEFNTFENDLKALVKKHFESDEAHVFNWLRGESSTLQELINDMHNRYTVGGLLAEDFSQLGLTAQELEDVPLTISELETIGKYVMPALSPNYGFSPVTGQYKRVIDIVYDVYEAQFKGGDLITSKDLNYIDNLNIPDLQRMVVS